MERAEVSKFVIRGDGETKLHGAETLFLSNVDQIMQKFHVRMCYFFSPPSEDRDFMSTQLLRDSLAQVLTVFWPVAGKFKDRGGGWLDVERCEEGVEFWEVKFKGTFAEELRDHEPKLALTALVPNELPGTTAPMSKTPLMKVQLSRFQCGTVCLVVAIHHVVCDGQGIVDFVRAWAEVASGKGTQSRPHLDRSALKARNPPVPSFLHLEYSTQPPRFPSGPPWPAFRAKLFEFTAAQVQILKEEVNRNQQDQSFTTFDALAGHVWKCMTSARGIDPLKVVKLGFTIDGRGKFVPPLPSNYFGNVVFHGLAKTTAGALVSQPLAHAASLVNEAKELVKDEYMRSTVDWVELQSNPQRVNRSFDCFCGSDVAMTSWSRFPAYETDFGWGKPTFFGIPDPFVGCDGLVVLLPSPLGPPAVNVLVALTEQHMSNLLHHTPFLVASTPSIDDTT